MIGLTVEFDLTKLDRWKLLTNTVITRGLRRAAAGYMAAQREDINKGVDVEGTAFAAYTPRYARLKTAAGRMGKGYWWRLTGRLLRSQAVKVVGAGKSLHALIAFDGMLPRTSFKSRKGRVTVSTRAGTMTSAALVATVVNRKRRAIGINPARRKKMVLAFERELRRAVKESKGRPTA